jgi:biopolymer transport protein ExbB/TolQ
MTRFLMEAGPMIWPVILLALVILILVIRNAVALIGKRAESASRRNSIDAVLFWGGFAAVIGFLGQWLGVMKLITAIVERGIVSPKAVVFGLSESLLTPIAGMFVLVAAAFLWFVLRVGLWSVERRS